MQFLILALEASTAPACCRPNSAGSVSPAMPAVPACKKLRRVMPSHSRTGALPIFSMVRLSVRAAHAAQRSKRLKRPLTPLRCVRGSDNYPIW